jgi:hypothetical protein
MSLTDSTQLAKIQQLTKKIQNIKSNLKLLEPYTDWVLSRNPDHEPHKRTAQPKIYLEIKARAHDPRSIWEYMWGFMSRSPHYGRPKCDTLVYNFEGSDSKVLNLIKREIEAELEEAERELLELCPGGC